MPNPLTKEQVMQTPELVSQRCTVMEIAKKFGVSKCTIQSLFAGKSHKTFQQELQIKLKQAREFVRGRATTKQCSKCHQVLPKTAEYFQRINRSAGFEARCLKCKSNQARDRSRAVKLRALRHYSGGEPHCACCGETRYEFLTFDHINGGGRKHREEMRKENGCNQIQLWLEKHSYPEGFRVLCLNCNGAIGFFGYCPHQVVASGTMTA